MSFSVHNAYLHMTNVNTMEDKRITPPPVIMILSLYCCVMRKSACMQVCVRVCVCVHLHVSRFCADERVCERVRVCLRARTKTPSGLSH